MTNEGRPNLESELVEKARGASFVGITSTTAEVQDAIWVARALRDSLYGKLPLVWGGWHTTLFPERMEASPLVDYAIVGEGEGGALQVAEQICGGTGRLNGKVVRSPYSDLNRLGSPRYDLTENIEPYVTRPLGDKFQEYYRGVFRWLPYESSCGYPHDCTFCINIVANNRRYRYKDPEKVAMELAELVAKYRLTHVKIVDDNFFVRIDRVRQIFEEVARLELDLPASHMAGDRISDIAAGHSAGCTTLLVQSGMHKAPLIESPSRQC